MKQVYYSDVSDTAPTLPATAVEGYPQDGTVSGNAQATVPGAYWFHMVSSELENAIRAGGKTPDATKVNQLAEVIGEMHAATNAVSYEPQTLTDAQRIQAKANIAADNLANARDYGATGDGSTDDTSAIAAAVATGKRVYLSSGDYAVSSADVLALDGEGNLKFSAGKIQAARTVGDYANVRQLVLGELKPAGRYVGQDLSYCDGSVYLAQQTYTATAGAFSPDSRVTFSQFAFAPDDSWRVNITDDSRGTVPTQAVTLTGIAGHGEACRAVKIRGQIYIYAQASDSAAGANDHQAAFTKIHWRGSDTTAADVVTYRGVRYVTNPMICLTPDAKYILFASAVGTPSDAYNAQPYSHRVVIYDREALEAASDLSVVEPVGLFHTHHDSFASTRSGFETDGKYIYVLYSKADTGVANQNAIDVYTFGGTFVRQIVVDPVATSIPEQWRYGNNGAYIYSREQEGLFIYKDMLVLCSKNAAATPGGVCTFTDVSGGYSSQRTYIATKELTGVPPGMPQWAPTDATISGATAYDVSRTYAAPTRVSYILALAAIAPAGHYAHEHPLNSTAWSPSKAQIESGERLTLSSAQGQEISFVTKWNNLTYSKDVAKLRADGTLELHNAIWKLSNPSLTRYGTMTFDADGNQLLLGTYGNSGALAIGSTIASSVNAYIAKDSPALFLKDTNINSTTAPATSRYGLVREITNDGSLLGHIQFTSSSGGSNITFLTSAPWVGSSAGFRIRADATSKSLNPSTNKDVSLGYATAMWSEVFAVTGTINTSDERIKANITDPSEALMRAWGKVSFKVFQFKDALEKKGDAARKHIGVIAQQVRDAFASEGLDAADYGLFCHDTWDEQPAEIDPVTGKELAPAIKAGDAYGIRYEEALALECAYQRWRLEKLEEKLNG